MSSLWTPDGERHVGRTPSEPATPAEGPPGGGAAGPATPGTPSGGAGGGFPVDEAAAAELARLRHELVQTPAAVVVANHAYGLFELAAIHLSEQPPNLAEAQIAVDAFGAVVESLGDRLGDAAAPLDDALAQIRLAFVQLSAAANPGPGTPGTDRGPSTTDAPRTADG